MNLALCIFEALKDAAGMTETEAKAVTEQVVEWGRKNGCAGVEHYWPCRFEDLPPGERDKKIRAEFNGKNLKAVCKKYGVSARTVYRALHN